MKRLLMAGGLAVAALSLPVTAALADGYERPRHAKPKPKAEAKPHAKAKAHQKAKVRHARAHAPYHGYVRDLSAVYGGRSYASVSLQQYEHVETTYHEQSSAGGSAWSSGYAGGHGGGYVSHGFTGDALAGGVGYGVDGGPVWSGPAVVVVPGVRAAPYGYGRMHGYYGGYAPVRPHVYGHPGRGLPHGHKHPGHR